MSRRDYYGNDPDEIRIREIRLDDDKERPSYVYQGTHNNLELKLITYFLIGMFLVLAVYLLYLSTARRKSLNENVYNSRQENYDRNVIRGNIVAENGTILAQTSVDYTGNEIRSYPYGRIYAHIVGYEANGKGGLEASCNTLLVNSHSPLLEQLRSASDNRKVQGDSVVVSLIPRLQEAAYYALGSYSGAVVVLEPDTGKILAMVSKPDFDPNTIAMDWENIVSGSDSGQLLNRAVQGLYPPGSTFKILTSLAWMRSHPNDADSFSYTCSGSLEEDEVLITCHNGAVHGTQNLREAFANSCNTAFAQIGLDLDNDQFRKTAEQFLFNKDLPIEIDHNHSVFSLRRNSSQGEQMTTAIGQGDTLVTPLHMALITAACANGGILMKPYLVSRIETCDGETVSETKPEIFAQMMSVDEAEQLSLMMQSVVSNGTAYGLYGRGYSAAGKTGSAEYENGDSTGTHSWFVGFSNVEDPDIVVAVIAENGGTGSSTAVPIAAQIFDAYYYY